MKKLLFLLLAVASFAQSPLNVQQGGAGRSGNDIVRDLTIGTGRTLTIGSGGTLTVLSGGTVNFGAGTIAGSALTGLYTDAGLTISAQNHILGRTSSGAGAAQELTASGVLDIIGATRGSILYRGASGWTALTPGTATYVLTSQGSGADPTWAAGGSGSGSVTSVGLALPNIFTVTNSPVTSTGTLTGTLAVQSANKVWAGPTTGADAAPTFRSLVAADIPSLSSVYQPLNSNLTAIAGLTSAANKLPYFTGSGTAGLADFTPAGFSLTLAGNTTISGTNTGDQTSVTGNAGTATALQNPRTINGVSFDGTANITVTAAAGTLTGSTLNATVTGSSLTSVGTIATGVWNGTAIAPGFGGTGSAFFGVAGVAGSVKTFTFPNANATVLTDNVAVTVLQGGTGINSGSSGGIPYFSSTTSIASSGTLSANQLILGGGLGGAPTPLSQGTSTTLLHGNASGGPTWSAVSLTADVSGRLAFSNLTQGSALSVLGVVGNATADFAAIAAASDDQVLRRSGTAIAFGAVNLASSSAVTGNLSVNNLSGGSGASASTYWRGDGTWAAITATASRLTATITQASHGFVSGDVLYNSNGTFAKAKADALATTYVAGVVESVTDANNFVIVYAGPITLSGKTATSTYYLSDATAGTTSTTAPTATGSFVVPIYYTGTTSQAYVRIGQSASLAKISLTTDVSGTLPVANGGTGAATLTGILQGNGTSAVTAITDSSTVGQVMRVTGTSTYAWGALDLANTNAVTGILAAGNGGSGNAFFAVSGPASSVKTFTLPNASSTILTTNATVTVGQGGTGIASGTSGGIPYYSGSTTIASSAALTANQIVLGGGAGAAPATLGSLGTSTTVLHGNVSGAPTFGSVDLANDITGNLGVTHLNSGTNADSSHFWRGDGTWATVSGTGTVTSVATNNGVTGGTITTTGTLSLDTSYAATWTAIETFNKKVVLGSTQSAAAWTTAGIALSEPAASYTDTSSSGTVAVQSVNHVDVPTLLASSSTTYTDSFGWDFKGPPVASTNVTQTRAHTLGILDSTSASSSITGGLIVAATYGTTATSVGIGGGNVNAGGNGVFGGTLSVTGHTTLEGVTSTGATGNGKLVYDTGATLGSPIFTTPTLGVATATSINKWTLTAPTTAATLTAGADNLTYTGPKVTSTLGSLLRDTFSNANKTMSSGTTILEQTGTMSAARTVTLAAANSYDAGTIVRVADVSGTVTGANTMIIARAGSDTINGGSTSLTLVSAYSFVGLETDGTGKWTVVGFIPISDTLTLTDGTTITWPIDSLAREQSAIVTLGGARTLAWGTTPAKGQSGTFKVIQDGTGGRTLALPANSKVSNGGAGVVTLSTAAAAVDILTWWSDGTNTYWNMGKGYN